MSSYPAYDVGVPALLAVWLVLGAACAAWLAARIQRRRPLDAIDHAAGVVLMLLGPIAGLAVAYDVTQFGLRRRRVRS